ncbi:MAG: cyclase family protein [Oscillospiraceae bacterium]|jgi:arylformamidase|nr:cyclase family protein [Oscillospiraceae bacterium]
MTDEDALAISSWRYPPRLNPCGALTVDELSSGWYRCAMLDGDRAGFLCRGRPARSPKLAGQYKLYPGDTDIGLGLRPDLVGKGLGLSLLEHQIDTLGRDKPLRLAFFEESAAAAGLYVRAGFRLSAKVENVLMMRREPWSWRDASRPLSNGMPVYPGDPAFVRESIADAADGGYNVTGITMTAHNGTHIDAPRHIGLDGGTDSWPVELLNGVCEVVDLNAWRGQPDKARRFARRTLLKTGGAPLDESEARVLVESGARMLGVDGLSVGPQGVEGLKTHRAVLGAGVCVLEGLALDGFEPGWYELMCLPLSLPGCDGAPARAMLRPLEV